LSATLESALEDQLRQRRRKEWLVTNGDSIEAYNRDRRKTRHVRRLSTQLLMPQFSVYRNKNAATGTVPLPPRHPVDLLDPLRHASICRSRLRAQPVRDQCKRLRSDRVEGKNYLMITPSSLALSPRARAGGADASADRPGDHRGA